MEEKVCRKCSLLKPITEFGIADKARGYRKAWCRPCEAARVRAYYASSEEKREKVQRRSAAWAKANPKTPEQSRRHSLKHLYGLTTEQYDGLVTYQGGACALCGAADPGRTTGKWAENAHWHIDHSHQDGRVRGLLCHACNTRLGSYETLLDIVGEAKLLDYLTRPSPVKPVPVPVIVAPVYVKAEPPPRYTQGKCTVPGCEKDQHAKGYCNTHYMRATRRAGDVGGVEALPHVAPKGEGHHLAKFTMQDARDIRASKETGVALAARYGVSVSAISAIRTGRTWKE